MASQTYYELLGVNYDADEQEIRRAYRRRIKELHPDQNPDDPRSVRRTRRLNDARETLLDPVKRRRYDKQLRRKGIIPDEPVDEVASADNTSPLDESTPEPDEYTFAPEYETPTAEPPVDGYYSHGFKSQTREKTDYWEATSKSHRRHASLRKRVSWGKALVTPFLALVGGIGGVSVVILLLWVGFRMDPFGLFPEQVVSVVTPNSQQPNHEDQADPEVPATNPKANENIEDPAANHKTTAETAKKPVDPQKPPATSKIPPVPTPQTNQPSAATDNTKNKSSDAAGRKTPGSGGRGGGMRFPNPETVETTLPYREALRGHSVAGIEFSPDGEWIACLSDSMNEFQVCNTKTGDCSFTLPAGNKGPFEFSPDGKYLAVCSGHSCRLLNPETGDPIRTIEIKITRNGATMSISNLRFSPDGKRVAFSISSTGVIQIVDTETGETVRELYDPRGDVKSLAFSPDGRSIVAGISSRWKYLQIWDSVSGFKIRSIEVQKTEEVKAPQVHDVYFTPDGQQIVSWTGVWDAETGDQLVTFSAAANGQIANTRIAIGPDGKRIVQVNRQGVWLWDWETGKQLVKLPVQKNTQIFYVGMSPVAFNPNGKQVAIAGGVNSGSGIRILELTADLIPASAPLALANALPPQPTSESIRSDPIEVRDLADGLGFIKSLSFSPDGQQVAIANAQTTGRRADGENDEIRLCDVRNGKEIRSIKIQNGRVISAKFSPHGQRIVAGVNRPVNLVSNQTDDWIELFDTVTGKRIKTERLNRLDWRDPPVFSPDGKSIVVIGNQMAKLLDSKSLELLWSYRVSKRRFDGDGVKGFQFSPNGRKTVVCDDIKFWQLDPQTGTEISTAIDVVRTPRSDSGLFAFTPDGKEVVTLGAKELGILNLETGSKRTLATGIRTDSFGVIPIDPLVSPDNRLIVFYSGYLGSTGNHRTCITILRKNTGEILWHLPAGDVRAIAMSPDGKQIVAGTQLSHSSAEGYPDGKVILFNLPEEEQYR